MVFRKYKAIKQWGKIDTHILKKTLEMTMKKTKIPYQAPAAVKDLGAPIYDAKDLLTPEGAEKIVHPIFKTPRPDDHPLWRAESARVFEQTEPMSDGVAQAAALTNSLVRRDLPGFVTETPSLKRITDLVTDSEVRDSILAAESYDPTLEKLPNRHDPILFWIRHPIVHGTPVGKRNNIILDNLVRHAQLAAIRLQADPRWRIDRDAWISGSLDSASSPLVFRGQPHILLQRPSPSRLWADRTEVAATKSEQVESVAPIAPDIDLVKSNIYTLDVLLPRRASLLASSLQKEIAEKAPSKLYTHAILGQRVQNQKYPWTSDQNAANLVLSTFGAAVAEAKSDEKTGLRLPCLVRGAQLCDGYLDLCAVQLNTLNIEDADPEGPKNIVWLEKAHKLYSPRPYWEDCQGKVEDVNVETARRLVAFLAAD